MPDESIHERITALDARTESETLRLLSGVRLASWPGGGEDRSEPGALDWIRRWRPERVGGATLPVCSCAQGACAVCN
jgi:hypothetical protein